MPPGCLWGTPGNIRGSLLGALWERSGSLLASGSLLGSLSKISSIRFPQQGFLRKVFSARFLQQCFLSKVYSAMFPQHSFLSKVPSVVFPQQGFLSKVSSAMCPQQGFLGNDSQQGFFSKVSSATRPQQGFLSNISSARFPQQQIPSNVSSARLPQQGFLSRVSSARCPRQGFLSKVSQQAASSKVSSARFPTMTRVPGFHNQNPTARISPQTLFGVSSWGHIYIYVHPPNSVYIVGVLAASLKEWGVGVAGAGSDAPSLSYCKLYTIVRVTLILPTRNGRSRMICRKNKMVWVHFPSKTSWCFLGALGAFGVPSGCLLGVPGGFLGASWEPPGSVLGAFWEPSGLW